MSRAPEISVVVPVYGRPEQLDRLLAGLDRQTLDADRFEVVVADDGSPEPLRPGPHAYAVRSVHQHDEGFRAAAARNLGAAAARGSVIAFLDQDCVPAPGYLERVAVAAGDPWALVVGHRRHAELDGWSADAVRDWLGGSGAAPVELPEPQWLLDGYARTDDLQRPDDRAYQLVISAVLSLNRSLFERLGGFDASFRGYGGEDWELAHRALVAGADLCWLPDAVAWHDGPDLAGRDEDLARTKNAETLALARRIPDADVRGVGLVWHRPDVVVRLDA
ncbi:MAG: glycosyltransferase, partial [Lapillicoccus sp.]